MLPNHSCCARRTAARPRVPRATRCFPRRVLPDARRARERPGHASRTREPAAGRPSSPGDARLRAGWLPAGEHVLSLATSLAAPNVSHGGTYLDEDPFVLVVGRQSECRAASDCWGPEPSTDYSSPSGPPRRITVPDDDALSIDCEISAPGLHADGTTLGSRSPSSVSHALSRMLRRRARPCGDTSTASLKTPRRPAPFESAD